MKEKRVILVTGATRGLGHALAVELAGRGHTVYGTGRSRPDEKTDSPFHPLVMDVNNDASVESGTKQVLDREGRIDVLVNNAGVSLSGPVEETPLDKARSVFETNYFGTVRTIQAVLPAMRKQGSGTIVNVASAAGKIGIPFQAHYAASKFAVEGLTEALCHELLSQGIRVLLIEPGDVKTTIWKSSEHVIPEGSPYTRALERFHEVKKKEMGETTDPPEKIARNITDIIESGTGKLRHPVAGMAGLFLLARKLLPDAIFLYAVRRNYGMKKK